MKKAMREGGFIFDKDNPFWKNLWKGMPEYIQDDIIPYRSIQVHFYNEEDIKAFQKLIGQSITDLTNSIVYPKEKEPRQSKFKCYNTKRKIQPKYPVYIISKGRWKSRMTVKALEEMNIFYHIVVEPQEVNEYASVIDSKKILVLPFSNLGQGSIPARNWVWEHSLSVGADRHWILDDNLDGFYRFNRNTRYKVKTGAIFRAAEDFVDRYSNVAISGFNYVMFAPSKEAKPPFTLNTRIYSCILIKNDIPYRWRGKYNEDTDLSLRVLKDKWCTVLFNAFLALKVTTMTMSGGNTEDLYQDDGRLKMAESLRNQHPDVVKITRKWGRYQHQVNYKPFRKNHLNRINDDEIKDIVNNYGMFVE